MMLQATYSKITTPVPSARESGRLRLGFFTSPAVNVTLFQASAEKSEPTWATARVVRGPTKEIGPPAPTCTGCCALSPAFRQKSLKLAAIACAFLPFNKHKVTSGK